MKLIDLTQITIRRANDNDLAEIVNLLADDELGKTRENNLTNQVADCYISTYNLIKNNPNHLLVVMDYQNEIIGTLQFIIIPTLTLKGCIRAEVEGVRIKTAYRGCGLGKLLFDWVKRTAIEKNCGLIQLTTNKLRPEACKFYKSIGFTDSHIGMKMILK